MQAPFQTQQQISQKAFEIKGDFSNQYDTLNTANFGRLIKSYLERKLIKDEYGVSSTMATTDVEQRD